MNEDIESRCYTKPRPTGPNKGLIAAIITLGVVIVALLVAIILINVNRNKTVTTDTKEVEKVVETVEVVQEIPEAQPQVVEEAYIPQPRKLMTSDYGLPDNTVVWTTGNVEDNGKEYPIKLSVKVDIASHKVTGKYAYDLTLRKYGDKPSSWFKLRGTYTTTASGLTVLDLVSENPTKPGVPFEQINLWVENNEIWGELINMADGKEFNVSLRTTR